MGRIRVSAALLLGAPAAYEVDGLRRALGSSSIGRIPSHITLVPPVNVAQDALPEVLDVLRRACGEARSFSLEIGPAATFWPDNPVVYLEVSDPGNELAALRHRVVTGPLSREAKWPFVPHVTLADDADPGRIPAMVSSIDRYRVTVAVEAVHLLAEKAGRNWRWEPIADALLQPPAVIGRGGLEITLTMSSIADPETTEWMEREWARYSHEEYGLGWTPDRGFFIAARMEHRLAGLAELSLRGASCELRRLIVGRASRGAGVGSHLLAAVEAFARDNGCDRCRIHTVTGGEATRFYRQRGWVEVVVLPEWRYGRDFVVMERRL